MAFYRAPPKFNRGSTANETKEAPIRDIVSDKGPLSRSSTMKGGKDTMNASMLSKGSAQTAATGKKGTDVTVAEVDKTKDLIDYKNETFNDIVYEIFAAREKIKSKIVEKSPDDLKSNASKRRRTTIKK